MIEIGAATGSLWAKSSKDGCGHRLVDHLLDTAAVAQAVLEREPEATRGLYAADLGLPAEEAVRWTAVVCGLHDLGKAAPVFQALWEQGCTRVKVAGFRWTGITQGMKVPHNWITAKVLVDELSTCGWQPAAARRASRAVGAHHGFPSGSIEIRCVTAGVIGTYEEWARARRALVQRVHRAVGAGLPPPVEEFSAAAFMRLAGLTSLADWIASDRDFFPYEPRCFAAAKKCGERALDHIGWVQRRPVTVPGASFSALFGRSPRPVQACVAELVPGARGPCMVVIEAPMGEGKTEAALYAHAQLEASGHRGLYVAMPTQATGNSMFDRVLAFLNDHGAPESVDLQLVHGAACLHKAFPSLQAAAVAQDDQDGPVEGTVIASTWFSPLKRALLSGYGVGTVDQALLGVLRVRHQFVRLWGLGNRTVVLDEVHAYELYTSRLIERLVAWLRSMGSSVIVLSATLPRARREDLYRAFGVVGPLPAVPYPRVAVADENGLRAVAVSASRTQEIALAPAPFDVEALAGHVWELARTGGCVAAIVNTVRRAQALYVALRRRVRDGSEDVRLDLVHARMPAEDREQRETALRAHYGPGGDRPQRAIVVGTQVIEQSLDLDFDALVTDLAPVDLVLQRAGRVHRHEQTARPVGTQARVDVAGLGAEIPDAGALATVYARYLLLRTWWVLRDRRTIGLPGDIEPLIEAVYDSEEPPSGFPSALASNLAAARAKLAMELQHEETEAAQNGLVAPELFFELLQQGPPRKDDDDPALHPLLQAPTRLGSPGLTVVPIYQRSDGLFMDAGGTEPLDVGRGAQDARRLLQRAISVRRSGLVSALRDECLPAPWCNEPLLRYVRPLWLAEDGTARVAGIALRLDAEMGVIYGEAENG